MFFNEVNLFLVCFKFAKILYYVCPILFVNIDFKLFRHKYKCFITYINWAMIHLYLKHFYKDYVTISNLYTFVTG